MCISIKSKLSILHILICIFYNTAGVSQTFTETGGIITDMVSTKEDHNYYPIDIQGLPVSMDDKFGFEKICLNIKHRRPTDLKIELISPQGRSVWISNRNGNNNTYGYLNTCFAQNGFNGPIYQSSRYFEGEYTAEGRLEFFNNGSDPNGMWVLVITDLSPDVLGELVDFSLFFSNNPASYDKSLCETNNTSDCKCSNQDSILLPDLILSKSLSVDNIEYTSNNHPRYPNKLRFASAMANIGEGPLHIVTADAWYCDDIQVDKDSLCANGEYPTNHVRQITYQLSGNKMTYDTLQSGYMYYDDSPGHNHYHVQNWASFKLLKKKW